MFADIDQTASRARRLTLALVLMSGLAAAQEPDSEKQQDTRPVPPGKPQCIPISPVTLHFAFGAKTLTPAHRAALRAFREVEERADALMEPEHGFQIEATGFTDPTGPEAVNWDLAAERAIAVANYLYSIGTPKRDLQVHVAGPIRLNQRDPVTRDYAHSRRVELFARCVINDP